MNTEQGNDADAELLRRARAADVAAYGALVRRHQRAALRVAAVICGSTEEAGDIVQEAFVKMYAKLNSHRGSGTVRSWMLRVVANEAKNHVRSSARRRRRDDRFARLQISVDDGLEEAADRRAEHESIARALASLQLTDREVLGCRFVGGLSEAETSAVLGIPVGTVKSRVSRSLARLAVALGEDR